MLHGWLLFLLFCQGICFFPHYHSCACSYQQHLVGLFRHLCCCGVFVGTRSVPHALLLCTIFMETIFSARSSSNEGCWQWGLWIILSYVHNVHSVWLPETICCRPSTRSHTQAKLSLIIRAVLYLTSNVSVLFVSHTKIKSQERYLKTRTNKTRTIYMLLNILLKRKLFFSIKFRIIISSWLGIYNISNVIWHWKRWNPVLVYKSNGSFLLVCLSLPKIFQDYELI